MAGLLNDANSLYRRLTETAYKLIDCRCYCQPIWRPLFCSSSQLIFQAFHHSAGGDVFAGRFLQNVIKNRRCRCLKTFAISRKRVSTPACRARRISSRENTKAVHEAALSVWFPRFPRLTHSVLLRGRMFDSRRNSTSLLASRRPSEAFAKNTNVRRARGISTGNRRRLLAPSNLAKGAF